MGVEVHPLVHAFHLRIHGLVLCELCTAAGSGYTLSAGVASNKLLAKIASGMHKPNQQTVVPPRWVLPCLQFSCVCEFLCVLVSGWDEKEQEGL